MEARMPSMVLPPMNPPAGENSNKGLAATGACAEASALLFCAVRPRSMLKKRISLTMGSYYTPPVKPKKAIFLKSFLALIIYGLLLKEFCSRVRIPGDTLPAHDDTWGLIR